MKLSRILLISLLLGLFPSCLKTEVLNTPQPMPIDTIIVLKAAADTTEQADTARAPIGWNVSVGDWEETEKDL